jgi:hypothetical protein
MDSTYHYAWNYDKLPLLPVPYDMTAALLGFTVLTGLEGFTFSIQTDLGCIGCHPSLYLCASESHHLYLFISTICRRAEFQLSRTVNPSLSISITARASTGRVALQFLIARRMRTFHALPLHTCPQRASMLTSSFQDLYRDYPSDIGWYLYCQ